MEPGDRPLILETWIRTSRSCDPWIDHTRHDYSMARHLERLLSRCPTWVAANREADDRILGWLCADVRRGLLHWVWVRQDWRRIGIAKELVAAAAREAVCGLRAFTGWSPSGVCLVRRLPGFQPWPECYRPDLGR